MALDGRRRLLALWSLRDAGRIADDYPVEAFVETDVARQAAAAVLTNTAVPVHVADVIVAVGKMLKAKLELPAIAAALGYGEVEVRRLAALSGLPPCALEGLRQGRLNLRQARLLARLPDRRHQAEIAQAALEGRGFQEWRITEQLDAGRITDRDPRFVLVGPVRYAEAGGRTDSDLFGERPATLLDPAVLHAAWEARAADVAAALVTEGRPLQLQAGEAVGETDLEAFGRTYGLGLDAAGLSAWRQAETAAREMGESLADADLAAPETGAAILAYLEARLAAQQAEEPARPVTLVQVTPSRRTGLDLQAYGPALAAEADAATEEDHGSGEGCGAGGDPIQGRSPTDIARSRVRLADAAPPQVEGIGHSLHAVRTDVATRALVRALADDPASAFVALVARLFCVLVLREGLGRGAGALNVQAEAYGRSQVSPIEGLDGDVRARLAARRSAWDTSGKSPVAWVADLEEGERMALMAELVGLSLDLREERTTSLRAHARAEAAEIAALCDADVTRHWTPDAGFLGAHPKGALLAMLTAMDAPAGPASALRKNELVDEVAKAAAERRWAPEVLSWRRAASVAEDAPVPEDPDTEPAAEG